MASDSQARKRQRKKPATDSISKAQQHPPHLPLDDDERVGSFAYLRRKLSFGACIYLDELEKTKAENEWVQIPEKLQPLFEPGHPLVRKRRGRPPIPTGEEVCRAVIVLMIYSEMHMKLCEERRLEDAETIGKKCSKRVKRRMPLHEEAARLALILEMTNRLAKPLISRNTSNFLLWPFAALIRRSES